MSVIRFAIHAVLFLIFLSCPLKADTGLNPIAFCADDPFMGVFNSVGVSAPSCFQSVASSQSKATAKKFAESFARNGCVNFSLDRCTFICGMSNATPLRGAEAHGVTFSSSLQSQKGFSAESVLVLDKLHGFCARTTFTEPGSTTPSGPVACVNPNGYPPFRPRFVGTARMNAFCGCTCR